MNIILKIVIILILLSIILLVSLRIRREKFDLVALSPKDIFNNLFGISVEQANIDLSKINFSQLQNMNSQKKNIFKILLRLNITEKETIFSKCIKYSNTVDFARCMELEIFKKLLDCKGTAHCQKKIVGVYIEIVRHMLFSEPINNTYLNIVKQISEIVYPGSQPEIGSTLNTDGRFTLQSKPPSKSIKNFLGDILFPEKVVNGKILNDGNCKNVLNGEGSKTPASTYITYLFSDDNKGNFQQIFTLIDFPNKYKMLYNNLKGKNTFSYEPLKKKQLKYMIIGCKRRNKFWKRDKSKPPECPEEIIREELRIEKLKYYYDSYFFYHTNQFLDSLVNDNIVYQHSELVNIFNEVIDKDMNNTNGTENDIKTFINNLEIQRNNILCNKSDKCCV